MYIYHYKKCFYYAEFSYKCLHIRKQHNAHNFILHTTFFLIYMVCIYMYMYMYIHKHNTYVCTCIDIKANTSDCILHVY